MQLSSSQSLRSFIKLLSPETSTTYDTQNKNISNLPASIFQYWFDHNIPFLMYPTCWKKLEEKKRPSEDTWRITYWKTYVSDWRTVVVVSDPSFCPTHHSTTDNWAHLQWHHGKKTFDTRTHFFSFNAKLFLICTSLIWVLEQVLHNTHLRGHFWPSCFVSELEQVVWCRACYHIPFLLGPPLRFLWSILPSRLAVTLFRYPFFRGNLPLKEWLTR